ncbi:MAG TPA: SCO family protein [Planctomycetes bacterium]|nr:SCO family protein [Planctomycetota bacterium]
MVRSIVSSGIVSASLGLLLLSAGCGGGTVEGRSSGPVLTADADDPIVFGEVPEFRFLDQDGKEVTREDLRGHPFAVAAIFTRCAGPCPRITAGMRRLQDELEGTDVRLVSVSVDPSYDRPEVLAQYASNYTADTSRWSFLTGTEEEVEAFLKDGLWLPLARAEAGAEPAKAVTHSTKIVAIDREGRIRGWYDGIDEKERELLRRRLIALAES